MWICNHCNDKKEHLNTYKEHYPYGDTNATQEMSEYDCKCNRGEYEEGFLCPICGEWAPESKFDEACFKCRNEILIPENALKYIKAKNLQEDFFVAIWTGAEVETSTKRLEEICERDWEFMYSSSDNKQAVNAIIEFVREEIADYVEWYVKEFEDD